MTGITLRPQGGIGITISQPNDRIGISLKTVPEGNFTGLVQDGATGVPNAPTAAGKYVMNVADDGTITWVRDVQQANGKWQLAAEQSSGIECRDWVYNLGNGADGRGGGLVMLEDNTITKIGWNDWLDGTNGQISVRIGIFFNPQANYDPATASTHPERSVLIPHPSTTGDNYHALVELDEPLDVPAGTRVQVDVIDAWNGATRADPPGNSNISVGSRRSVIAVGFVNDVDSAPATGGTGVDTFEELTDTPDDIEPLKFVQGNAAGDGLIFVDPPTGVITRSDAAPQALGTASAGTSNDVSRADHVHPLPSNASPTQAGLMSAADKTKLDSVAANAEQNVGVTYTQDEKTKLAGIEAGAQVNVGETYTATEKTKLAGIAAGAQVNDTGNQIVAKINLALGSNQWQTGGENGGTAPTDDYIEDLIGVLIAALPEFTYDSTTNTFTFTLPTGDVQDIAGSLAATSSWITYDSTAKTIAVQMPDNAVTTDKILNGAVTTDKMADNAVTGPKILTNAIGTRAINADTDENKGAFRDYFDTPSRQDVEFDYTDYSGTSRPVIGTDWFNYHFYSLPDELRNRSQKTGRDILLSAHFEVGPTNGVTVNGQIRVRYSNDANASSNTGTWVELGDTIPLAFTSGTRQNVYVTPRVIPTTARHVQVGIRRVDGAASMILYDSSIHVTIHSGEIGYYPQNPSADEQRQARTNIDAAKRDLSDLPSDLDATAQTAIKTKLNIPDGGGGITLAQAKDQAGNLVGNVPGFNYTGGNLTFTQPHDSIPPEAAVADTAAQKLAWQARLGITTNQDGSQGSDGNLQYHRLGTVNLFFNTIQRRWLDSGINISGTAPDFIRIKLGHYHETNQSVEANFLSIKYDDLVQQRMAQSQSADSAFAGNDSVISRYAGSGWATYYFALAGNGNLLVASSAGGSSLYNFEVGYQTAREGRSIVGPEGPPGAQATVRDAGVIRVEGLRRQDKREESYGGIATGTSIDGDEVVALTKGHDGTFYVMDSERIEGLSAVNGGQATGTSFRTISNRDGLVWHPGLSRYFSLYQNKLEHLGTTGISPPETIGTIGGTTASAYLGLCIDETANDADSLFCFLRAGSTISPVKINPTTGSGSAYGLISGFSGTPRCMAICQGIPFLFTYNTSDTTLRVYSLNFDTATATLHITLNDPDGDPRAVYYDVPTDRLIIITNTLGFSLIDRYTNGPRHEVPHDVASVDGDHSLVIPLDLATEVKGLTSIIGAVAHRNQLNPGERYFTLPAGSYTIVAASTMVNASTAAGNKGERVKTVLELLMGDIDDEGAGSYARGSENVGNYPYLSKMNTEIATIITLDEPTSIRARVRAQWNDDRVSNVNEIKALYQLDARIAVMQGLVGSMAGDPSSGNTGGAVRGTYTVIDSGTYNISIDTQTQTALPVLTWDSAATYQDITFTFAQTEEQSGALQIKYQLRDEAGAIGYYSVLNNGAPLVLRAADSFRVRFTREHLVGNQLRLYYEPHGLDDDSTVRVQGTLSMDYEDLGTTSAIASARWHNQLDAAYFLGQVSSSTTVANATVTTLDFEEPFAPEELMGICVGYRINDVDKREWFKTGQYINSAGYAELTDNIRSDDNKSKRILFGEWPSRLYKRDVAQERDNAWIESTTDDSPLVAMMLMKNGAEVTRSAFMCWTASCEILYIKTLLKD